MAANALECSTIIAVDIEDHKLKTAKELGATHLINNRDGGALDEILKFSKNELLVQSNFACEFIFQQNFQK